MNHDHLKVIFKSVSLTTAIILLNLTAEANPWLSAEMPDSLPAVAATNNSIIILGGDRATGVATLAAVKQEKSDFITNILEPHNRDAEEQKRQMADARAALNPDDPASVAAYNRKIVPLNAWGKRIDDNKKRLDPQWFDINMREQDYTKKIEELEARIKELIRIYKPDCLNEGDLSIEAIVNCWGIYFDGEGKRGPLPVVVPGGIWVYPNGAPPVFTELTKEYKERHKIDNTPGPPELKQDPPQKGILEKATDKVRQYYNNFINNNDSFKSRRTSAVKQ